MIKRPIRHDHGREECGVTLGGMVYDHTVHVACTLEVGHDEPLEHERYLTGSGLTYAWSACGKRNENTNDRCSERDGHPAPHVARQRRNATIIYTWAEATTEVRARLLSKRSNSEKRKP